MTEPIAHRSLRHMLVTPAPIWGSRTQRRLFLCNHRNPITLHGLMIDVDANPHLTIDAWLRLFYDPEHADKVIVAFTVNPPAEVVWEIDLKLLSDGLDFPVRSLDDDMLIEPCGSQSQHLLQFAPGLPGERCVFLFGWEPIAGFVRRILKIARRDDF